MKNNLHSRRIVVATSEEPLGRVIEESLSLLGIGVDIVGSHGELLRLCRHRRYPLIITRFVAPLLSSPAQIMFLRAEGTTKIFVLSHTRNRKIALALLRSGVSQFLSLPISIHRLRSKVASNIPEEGAEW